MSKNVPPFYVFSGLPPVLTAFKSPFLRDLSSAARQAALLRTELEDHFEAQGMSVAQGRVTDRCTTQDEETSSCSTTAIK